MKSGQSFAQRPEQAHYNILQGREVACHRLKSFDYLPRSHRLEQVCALSEGQGTAYSCFYSGITVHQASDSYCPQSHFISAVGLLHARLLGLMPVWATVLIVPWAWEVGL